MLEKMLITKEVCEVLSLSKRAVLRLVKAKQITAIKVSPGPRAGLRFHPAEIRRFQEQGFVMPEKGKWQKNRRLMGSMDNLFDLACSLIRDELRG